MGKIDLLNDTQAQVEVSAYDDARRAAEAARQVAYSVQQSGRAASDALREVGAVTADATRQNSQTGLEAMQRVGNAARETMRKGAETFSETQRQFVQKTAGQFAEASRRMAQASLATGENVRAFMTLPSSVRSNFQDMQTDTIELVESVARQNVQAAQELFQLANPVAYFDLHQRVMRGYFDVMTNSTATLARAARRTADEMLRPIEQHIEQHRQVSQAQPHQNAAA